MKRIFAAAGVLAAGSLLASALVAPAQAAPGGTTASGEPVAGKNALDVVSFWLASNGKALKDAVEYHPDRKVDTRTARLNTQGALAGDGKPGVIPPIGGEKSKAAKPRNVNLSKTVGKVFFLRDGKPYWCSATSVQSKYRNLVATAGHCAYDTDDNAHVLNRWVFVPGYYQGRAPFGVYAAKQAFTHYDFDVYEDFDRDYAFVSVYNGLNVKLVGKYSKAQYDAYPGPKWTYDGEYYYAVLEDAGRLGDAVGGQGLAYNITPGNKVYAFGYPAGEHPDGDKPYNGLTQKWVYGTTSETVVDSALKIEGQIALKGALTQGFDGAPWLLKYNNTTRLGYVNGVTSTFIDADGNSRYDHIGSPFFDGETYRVYATAANVWSGSILPKNPKPSSPTPSPTKPSPSPTTSSPSPTKPSPTGTTPPPSGTVGTAEENEVVRLTNAEREKGGCKPLKHDPQLRAAAFGHSDDMAKNSYFSHASKDGRSFMDRINASGFTGGHGWAENIAAGQTSAADVVHSWMNSSGHRANIMNCGYTLIGVGLAKNSKGTNYWTQDFAAK
ncbi:CAP domain-containing protein [Sphaerisporangium fuscum]|uniref:CAP domain-containing protein n=1 Tax=Sphaerisporangium fuscum TaxID=2835868 RepID=UPI001BDC1B86|nr:CAP domain-containing protein [Sphaerisporangium fuscum]